MSSYKSILRLAGLGPSLLQEAVGPVNILTPGPKSSGRSAADELCRSITNKVRGIGGDFFTCRVSLKYGHGSIFVQYANVPAGSVGVKLSNAKIAFHLVIYGFDAQGELEKSKVKMEVMTQRGIKIRGKTGTPEQVAKAIANATNKAISLARATNESVSDLNEDNRIGKWFSNKKYGLLLNILKKTNKGYQVLLSDPTYKNGKAALKFITIKDLSDKFYVPEPNPDKHQMSKIKAHKSYMGESEYRLPERLRRLAGQTGFVRPGLEEDFGGRVDDLTLELAGVKSALPGLGEAKKTYPQAASELMDYLEGEGWKLKRNLKIPHATSPRGEVRLWFKPQAIWASYSTGPKPTHSFKDARSLHVDMRQGPKTVLSYVGKYESLTENVANTIWKQIPMATKMAVGARKPVADKKSVKFQVLRKPYRFVIVSLDPSDTYTVEFFRLKRNDLSKVTLGKQSGVYAEDLGAIIYGLTHGKIK